MPQGITILKAHHHPSLHGYCRVGVVSEQRTSDYTVGLLVSRKLLLQSSKVVYHCPSRRLV